jgi:hypothetical protein
MPTCCTRPSTRPKTPSPSPRRVKAATTIQARIRGMQSRSRTNKLLPSRIMMRETSLPGNMVREIMRRIPPSRENRRYAPKVAIPQNIQNWMKRVYTQNAFRFPNLNANEYNRYLNAVYNMANGPARNTIIKAIIARYFLNLQALQWPNAFNWVTRVHTNFYVKYNMRQHGLLSLRELYAFLLTKPTSYLLNIARSAPTYA